MDTPKIIRACTVPSSLGFVEGMIEYLQQSYEVILLSSPGLAWEQIRIAHPNVKCVKVCMERRISLMKDLKALWILWHVFLREKPAMVHSMTPKAGLLCMLAAWLARVPVRVHTFTGLVFPTSVGLKRRVLMATDWLTCACATHVIPEGEGVKRDLMSHGITKKDIRVLGYGNVRGIDLCRFDPSLNYCLNYDFGCRSNCVGKSTGSLTFIVVGRLVGDKGINEVVAAFVRLYQEYPIARLVLVGGYEECFDPLEPKTLEAIERHPAIHAVGVQHDVRPWFAISDVAILASYREGFPNVVIEAGAMGLPQIVTDINGANEIIEDGKNGIIVPSKNTDALYKAMMRMTDKELRDSLSKNARKMVASRYDQHFVRKCLYDFYKEIL